MMMMMMIKRIKKYSGLCSAIQRKWTTKGDEGGWRRSA